MRRPLATALAGAVALVAGWGVPVAADPARPTDYRSRVLSVRGDLPAGTSIQVVGGDAFLELSVPAGHTAEVPDTTTTADGEPRPYLRFAADGTVERNATSFSAIANETRYGTAGEDYDPDAEPRWEQVADDGTYVWHDHRIHWMSASVPTAVDDDGRVDLGGPDGTWSVPLVVDGAPVTVTGELLLLDAPNPIGWIALAATLVVGAAALGWQARRRRQPVPYRPVAAGVAAVGVAAAVTGWAAWQDVPAAAGGNALPFVVPAIGLAAAVLAAAGPRAARLPALGAAAAALVGWGVLRWSVLTHAVLPTDLPFAVDRAATALAIGAGVGLAALLVWQPPLRGRAAAPKAPTASPTA